MESAQGTRAGKDRPRRGHRTPPAELHGFRRSLSPRREGASRKSPCSEQHDLHGTERARLSYSGAPGRDGRVPGSVPPVIDPNAKSAPAARLLGLASAWLVLLGFLTGIYVAQAMTGKIPADPRAALAAHLNALLGAFLMLGVASTLPLLRYGPVRQRRLAWAFIAGNFANSSVTAVKAWWHVAGVDRTGDPRNDLIFAVLGATVVLPSLVGAAAWIYGFYGPRTSR